MGLRFGTPILASGILFGFLSICLTTGSPAQQSQTRHFQRGVEPEKEPNADSAIHPGPYFALVIGIDDYQNLEKLKTAAGDARAIAAILHDIYGFQTQLLLNGKATREEILKELYEYRRTLGKDASLLIYYAGHGYNDAEAGKTYWLPVDAGDDNSNWIQSDNITADLKAIQARHILVISDSCYSGSMRDVNPHSSRLLRKQMEGQSRTLLSSGQNEPVSDEGKGSHSAFAGPLINALENASEPWFSAPALFEQIQGIVAGNSEQTPSYGRLSNSGDDGYAEFIFFRHGLESGIPSSSPDAPISEQLPVAVLGFKNLGKPEANSLSVAISEIFSSELAASGRVRSVSTEEVTRATAELKLPDSSSYATDTLSRIRKRLPVDAVFVGSYMVTGQEDDGRIELNLCAQYMNSGNIVCAGSKRGSAGSLAELVSKAGDELLEKMRLPTLTPTVEAQVMASYPTDPAVMRHYTEGLENLGSLIT
jgi:uncharacterized caspase-like protein